MKNQQLAMITMTLNEKNIQFWLFSLQFDALFGSLDCDYTHN
jgi:hypothetical protein